MGKCFIFSVNLGICPLKSIISRKMSPGLSDFNTHLEGFYQGDMIGKCSFIASEPRHVPPHIKCLREPSASCSEDFNTHL